MVRKHPLTILPHLKTFPEEGRLGKKNPEGFMTMLESSNEGGKKSDLGLFIGNFSIFSQSLALTFSKDKSSGPGQSG